MRYTNILITGGSGFIGSTLAIRLKERHPAARVTALDNLRRRGSELNVPRLAAAGVAFAHGDIRCPEDLTGFPEPFDLLIECSAEPSVLAGFSENPGYLIQTNLGGTVNCLELARRDGADLLFFSTSRVYPVRALTDLALEEAGTRFELAAEQTTPGVSPAGVSESFPLTGSRTLYGATKLASELLIQEYGDAFGLRAIVNRCGVVAGPWQMGRVDQGVFGHWLLAHLYRRPLRYIGYGGTGKQVRDLLHVDDLFEATDRQLEHFDALAGQTFNLGGGRDCSLSLLETTALCREITGNTVDVAPDSTARSGDVPLYLSDGQAFESATGWRRRHSAADVLRDIHDWARAHERALAPVFAP